MRVRKKLGVCYVLMVLLTIAIVIPIIWLVFISMKPNSEIMNNPLSLPNALDFGNYVSALQTLDLFTLYKNTAFYRCLLACCGDRHYVFQRRGPDPAVLPQ